MAAAGVPQPVIAGFGQASASGNFDLSSLTGVGDMGAAILAAVPAQFQALIAPVIPQMVEGIHGAFSLATAQTFYLGVFGAIVSVIAAVAIKEIPLRTSNEQPTYSETAAAAAAAAPTGGAPAPRPVADGVARSSSQPTVD